MPKVSVVMAVHNGEPYLGQAINSILEQSFTDFEFVIIDDASTDGSSEELSGLSDERIRVIENKRHVGLSSSLNRGIEAAKGEYLARMDHDDISLPERLQRQVDFLDTHPGVDVLGTWARTLGLGHEQTWRYPTSDEDIRSEFIFNSALVHSSVMLRKNTFERLNLRYDEGVRRAQDYEVWTRAAPQIRFANLDATLLRYRVHSGQVGNQHSVEQRAAAEKVRLRELGRLGVKSTETELNLHNRISRWEVITTRAELQALSAWFLKLRAANKHIGTLSAAAFDRALERRWWAACKANVGLGLEAWRIYAKVPFGNTASRSHLAKAQFWAKAALREIGWRQG
jgi:glycosyltransferase involved in cell wall biosynthesis